MAFEYISIAVDEHVATITMNRPPVNAMNQQFADELFEAFATVYVEHEEVRAVVLASALERAFCVGSDVKAFPSLTARGHHVRYVRLRALMDWIYEFPLPVVAALDGYVLGGGMVLAALCDIRVATERAVFGVPEIVVGSIGGLGHTARMLPQGYARWLGYTGRQVGASELYRLGALQQIVEPAELLPAAQAIAREIAQQSPLALRFAKAAFNEAEVLPASLAVANEFRYSAHMRGTADAAEAQRAFVEKRKPVYTGR